MVAIAIQDSVLGEAERKASVTSFSSGRDDSRSCKSNNSRQQSEAGMSDHSKFNLSWPMFEL